MGSTWSRPSPGWTGSLGRYNREIRADRDTRSLPAPARRDLLAWLGRRLFGAAWSPRDFAHWARGRARYQRFVRDYARLGGRVLVGTDALQPCAGYLFHQELRRLRACGLPAAAVLRAATAAAADTLGRPDLGRIAPGATADLVLVAGDPLRQLSAARAVQAVVVGGRLVDPRALLRAPQASQGGPR